MLIAGGRYGAVGGPQVSSGWTLERLTPPSRLFGAHGIAPGADGRLYVAQLAGSQVSAVDIDQDSVETISAMGGDIVGPDDLAFDDKGNLYVTEITENRVSMRTPDGDVRIIADVPIANPITWHRGRLFSAEFRRDGRIIEIDPLGGEPRVVLDNVPLVNGFAVGPDEKLYFPVMGTNEIWRINLDGSEPEVVASNLGRPNSVKVSEDGFIVSTQVASGQLLKIDPRSGERVVLADLQPGLDNCAYVGSRLFVSSISGQITEILKEGQTRILLPDGLQWPLGLAVDENRTLYAADGGYSYTFRPGGTRELAGMLFTAGYPGFVRGVATAGPDYWIVTTANGEVVRFWPLKGESQILANGYDKLMGIAIVPGGAVYVAESGTGRILAIEGQNATVIGEELQCPMGVATDSGGACYVAERGSGRVTKLSRGRKETVLDGLTQPEGVTLHDDRLYVVDVGEKTLVEADLQSGARRIVLSGLPVGAPPGMVRKPLGSLGKIIGPMISFAGIACDPDGSLYVAADAEGSILAVRPERQHPSA